MGFDTNSDAQVEWLDEIDSTNSELLRRAQAGNRHVQCIAARRQNNGRGRNGKAWDETPDALYFSALLHVTKPLPQTASLSLVLGVAASEAIAEAITPQRLDIQLKWPNDLMIARRKFGGILLEVANASADSCWIVAGIGVNTQAAALPPERTDLHREGVAVSSHTLAILIARFWLKAVQEFNVQEFLFWHPRWQARCALAGQWVQLSDVREPQYCQGVTTQGALHVQNKDGEPRLVHAGDVQLSTRWLPT